MGESNGLLKNPVRELAEEDRGIRKRDDFEGSEREVFDDEPRARKAEAEEALQRRMAAMGWGVSARQL